MKGFAALCVVFGHVANVYYDSQLYSDIRGFEYVIDKVANSFHMFLFMMISGYLYQVAYIDEDGKTRYKHLRRQMVDMLGVYVLFSVVFGISRVAFGQFAVSENTLIDVLLIAIKPLGPYWYLYILLIYYGIYSHKKLREGCALLHNSALVFAALISPYISCPWIALPNLLYYLIAFDLGMVLRRKQGFIHGSNKNLLFLLFTIGVLLLALRFMVEAKEIELPLFYKSIMRLSIAIGLSLAIWFVFQNTKDASNLQFLSYIGRYALEIYVLHLMVVVALKIFLPRIGVSNGVAALLLNFLLSVLLPIAFSLVCKYTGIHGLLFRPVSTVGSLLKKEK